MAKGQSVEAFLDGLKHARIEDIRALRKIILSVDPAMTERVKWNAPSFCYEGDDRVTMRLHPGDRLELIFHRGAKPRDSAGFAFDDPAGRIAWAAPDRGVLKIGNPEAEREAITKLVSAWLAATTTKSSGSR